jgi:flagellin-like protein
MTMASSGPARGSRTKAESDIYTVLVVVAFLFVLTATIYVGYRVFDLFGTVLPPPGS